MIQPIATDNKRSSGISNTEQLQAEIRKVKTSIKSQEDHLHERWKQLPQETIKATAGAVFPFFLNNAVAAKTFGIVKGAGSLLFGNPMKGKGDIKENLFSAAKQLGLFTALRGLYNLWRKK